jgi:site-specific DNA recombinase
MKAAVYCRVSTEVQSEDGTSLETQLAACLAKAADLGYDVPVDFYFGDAVSGLTTDRPALDKLRRLAREKAFSAVIIYSPDRLSRQGESILTLAQELKSNKIKLISVNREFDDSLNGKVVAFILGWASELEAEQIKERTMRGKRFIATQGGMPQGTGKGIYGYDWDANTKQREPNEFEAKIVNRIFEMIASGQSRHAVACSLNEMSIPSKAGKKWHPLTIDRIIKNEDYIGKSYYGKSKRHGKKVEMQPESEWIFLPDVTPPIVSQDLFDRANQSLSNNKRLDNGIPTHEYLLSGYIRCPTCGTAVVGSCLNHKYRYYRCRGTIPTSTRGIICHEPYIYAEALEGAVWGKILAILANPNIMLNEQLENKPDSQEYSQLKTTLDNYAQQEKRLIKLYRLGDVTDDYVQGEMKVLAKERDETQAKLNQMTGIKQAYTNSQIAAKLLEFCNDLKKRRSEMTLQDKRMILTALSVQVKAIRDKAEMKVNINLNGLNIEKTFNFEFIVKKKRPVKIEVIEKG